ncbi:MAG: PD40 domain-containing protein [Candidatus Aminicenantes bacterium]|nr:PD40 domain-containing protein [Candidatus Aminicenantes bacterium]
MNRKFSFIISLSMSFFILCISEGFTEKTDISVLKGPYLGQEPPGMTPEIFAPGIVSTEESDGCVGFGMGGDLFLFQKHIERKSYTYEMTRKDNRWSAPKLIPFSDSHQVGDFALAPDGKTLYFQSNIFIEEIGKEGEGGNIWMVERTSSGWTEPKALGPAVNTKYHDSYPCVSEDGTLYFFSRRPGGLGKSDLYVSSPTHGEYKEVGNMGEAFNTSEHEWDPYIAPDKSYIIFCSMKPGGYGEDDFYISFRKRDGSWTDPVNMREPINSSASENRPWVSLDGKYFFFTSNRPGKGKRDVYWVSAKIIEKLKPEELKVRS